VKTPPQAEAFVTHTATALQAGTFAGLLLSVPTDKTQPVQRILGRLVTIKQLPMLSLTLREERRDTTKNLSIDEVDNWLAAQLAGRYRSVVLETTSIRWQLTVTPKGKARLVSHRASAPPLPVPTIHDRKKASLLDRSALPWLSALGLCDGSGRIRPSAANKHRQLERYLEVLSHLIRESDWRPDAKSRIADMGSGKGYLTFGAWHLLNRTLGLETEIIGVEARPELVEQSNSLARTVGAANLHFVVGNIASVTLDRLDGLLALHACNTATDLAISRGIQLGAKLIVVSPCCHQELRPRLGRPPLLAPLLSHGILAERLSEWLTDGLRALRLEQAGYATKVIEFVASEHTPRNLLIAGIRRDHHSHRDRTDQQIRALKEFFQIGKLASDDIASNWYKWIGQHFAVCAPAFWPAKRDRGTTGSHLLILRNTTPPSPSASGGNGILC